tara:strand:- start:34893 stop:35858 length:966 start_codon:yes stop_codon:yes gene_type:complete
MINSVRNTVLAIANKNNYGYISPQDFNLYCLQAQMDLFEDYFYQYNNWINRENQRTSGTGYADIIKNLEEVIDTFSATAYLAQPVANQNNQYNLPADYYLINKIFYYPTLKVSGTSTGLSAGTLLVDSTQTFTTSVSVGDVLTNTTDNTSAYITEVRSDTILTLSESIMASGETYSIYDQYNITEVERVNQNKLFYLTSSNLTYPTTQYPAYVLGGASSNVTPGVLGNTISVYPTTITQGGALQAQYIRYPLAPNWTYLTTSGQDPIFNPAAADYQSFELPASDEPNLVAKICQYIGIEIREDAVYKFGQTEELTDTQETS